MGAKGKITQIIGPVVDFKFPSGELPELGHSVELIRDGGNVLFLRQCNI